MVISTVDSKLLESKMILAGYKSRKEFAEAIEVTPHAVGNILNHVHNPSYEVINSMYRVLDLTPDEGHAIFFNSNLRNTKVKSS